jgi:hypothetical protein
MDLMDKFWKWMEDKLYCDEDGALFDKQDSTAFSPTKNMLIGYMLEYIRDHKYWDESEQQPFPEYEMEFRMAVWGRNQYECFKEIIEKIDNG